VAAVHVHSVLTTADQTHIGQGIYNWEFSAAGYGLSFTECKGNLQHKYLARGSKGILKTRVYPAAVKHCCGSL